MKINNRVFIPRKLAEDFLAGRLTSSEFFVLIWLWLRANHIKGSTNTGYMSLVENLRNQIKYPAMRKIISSLRKKRYINFANHSGRTGPFDIYPIGFFLANKKILNWKEIEQKLKITASPQPPVFEDAEPENSLDDTNHNLEFENEQSKGQFRNKPPNVFTAPDNDTEKDKNKKSTIDKQVRANEFAPRNSDEQRCKEIALELRETDMKFILSALRDYGLPHLERCLGLLKEKEIAGGVKNKNRYFNHLVKHQK